MSLTNNQKKYIRKSISNLSADRIAKAININKKEIKDFLIRENYSYSHNQIIEDNNKEKKINEKLFFSNKTVIFFILSILIIVCYIWTLGFKFVSDDIYILKTKNLGSIRVIFEQPQIFLATLHYFIINKLVGASPWLYRLANIIFHIGNAFFVYLIVSILSFPLLAFILSVFFAVHPILVESVTWISGGPYVRYSFFFLVSFYLYIRSKEKQKYYLWSLVFFVLCLFSSDKAIVTPLLFLLYEVALGRVREIGEIRGVGGIKAIRESWKKLSVYLGISGIWILFYLSQFSNRISRLETLSYGQTKILNPLVQIPIAITTYLQLIFWPDKLTLYHSEMSYTPIEYAIRVIGVIGVIGVIIYGWKKNKQIFFWLSFFIISLLPTLTPFGISWIVAERYVYLGSVGVLFVISYLLFGLIKNEKTKVIGYLLFVICLLGLMTRTIVRNMDWKNEDTLWLSMKDVSVSDPKTHNNLGDMYGRHGDLKKAEEEFKLAIKLNPNYGDAYHNLGNVYLRQGKNDLAIKNYEKAASTNPNLWQSYQNIAAIYFNEKKFNQALIYMEKAIKASPPQDNLYLNLGIIYAKGNNLPSAKAAFEKALEINPSNQKAKELLILITKPSIGPTKEQN